MQEIMSFLVEFFRPCYEVARFVAYWLSINLEGIHAFGALNNIYDPNLPYPIFNLDPTQGLNILAGGCFFIVLAILWAVIRAGFVLGRVPGVIITTVLLVPGVASVLGYMPKMPDPPRAFHYGLQGDMGSPYIAAIVFFLLFIFGWAVMVIIASFFKSHKFKLYYEHVWCAVTLVGCIYLVVDNQVRVNKDALTSVGSDFDAQLSYYQDAYRKANVICHSDSGVLSQELCGKISAVSRELARVRYEKNITLAAPYFSSFELSSLIDSSEVEVINDRVCGKHGELSGACSSLPVLFDMGVSDIGRKMLVPGGQHNKSLERYYKRMVDLAGRVKLDKEKDHYKLFVFFLIAFLAGGKASIASVSLVGEAALNSRSWLIWFLQAFYRGVSAVVQSFWWVLKGVKVMGSKALDLFISGILEFYTVSSRLRKAPAAERVEIEENVG
ncbi:hypothetical protein [Pseudomonas sp. WPR_5_2]|uniref:hypothetical protein n=1 Tax=Pseudomonas sp. WPR_5_2 TaxID=1907371 RepID=UPI0011C39510|nr:hypothetical protein [Pseudomonas sp. WPR_5_2]